MSPGLGRYGPLFCVMLQNSSIPYYGVVCRNRCRLAMSALVVGLLWLMVVVSRSPILVLHTSPKYPCTNADMATRKVAHVTALR